MKHDPPCGHTNYDVSAHQFWDEDDLAVRCNVCQRFWAVRGEQMLEATVSEDGTLANPFGSDSVIARGLVT